MRLDKLLGQAGYGSRNQVKKLIRSRQVYVDGVLGIEIILMWMLVFKASRFLVRNWSMRQKSTTL